MQMRCVYVRNSPLHPGLCMCAMQKKKRFEIIIHCFSRSFLDTSGCHNGFSPSVMRKVAYLQTLPSITCCSTLLYMSFYTFFFNFCLQSHDVTIVCFFFIWDRDGVWEKEIFNKTNEWPFWSWSRIKKK